MPLALLDFYSNQIKGEAMDALISNLPQNKTNKTYEFRVYYVGNDGNVCTKSQVAAAIAKGWTPYYYSLQRGWQKYEGMDDDEAASIILPELENGTAESYNLAGQKVTAPEKGGVYIVGGKKVVVK